MNSASHSRREPTQTPRGEWYALVAEGRSALRIRSGFTIGEAEDGALAVNDPDPARRWIEFHIEDADTLWVEALVPGLSLEEPGGPGCQQRLVTAGSRLALPHTTLHVSRDIRLADQPGALIEVIVESPRADEPAERADPNQEPPAHPDPEWDQDPPADQGPHVLEVIADLREQLGMNRAAHRQDESPPPSRAEAAPEPETTLRRPPPVFSDASSARAADSRPSTAAEPSQPDVRSVHDAPARAPQPSPGKARQRPGYRRRRARPGVGTGLLGGGALILLAALVLRGPAWLDSLNAPGATAERPPEILELPRRAEVAEPEPKSDSTAAAELPAPSSGSGLADASANATPSNIRSGVSNRGAAAAPDTLEVRAPAPARTSGKPASGTGVQPRPQPPAPATNAPVTGTASAAAAPPPPATVASTATGAVADAGRMPTPAANGRPTGAAAQPRSVYTLRLNLARSLIAEGEITTPPGSNAVDVLTGILEEAPDQPEARALIAQCADTLVAEAVEFRDSGRDYEARNTLEEVLNFAPNHPEATRLWRDWVGTSP